MVAAREVHVINLNYTRMHNPVNVMRAPNITITPPARGISPAGIALGAAAGATVMARHLGSLRVPSPVNLNIKTPPIAMKTKPLIIGHYKSLTIKLDPQRIKNNVKARAMKEQLKYRGIDPMKKVGDMTKLDRANLMQSVRSLDKQSKKLDKSIKEIDKPLAPQINKPETPEWVSDIQKSLRETRQEYIKDIPLKSPKSFGDQVKQIEMISRGEQ